MTVHDDTNEFTGSTPQQQLLRYYVHDAVQRELTSQLAPHVQQLLNIQSKVSLIDRDIGSINTTVGEVKNVVLGNDSLGIVGLRREFREVSATLKALLDQREAIQNQILGIKTTVRWAAGILSGLGVLLTIPQLPAIVRILQDLAN